MTPRVDIGAFLQALRTQRTWSLRQLSLKAQLSHHYLQQVEAGSWGIPRATTLHKLEGVYGFAPHTLCQLLDAKERCWDGHGNDQAHEEGAETHSL